MTAPASRRPPPGPLMAVLVLLLVAIVGGFAGVAVDRLVLLPTCSMGPGSATGMDREARPATGSSEPDLLGSWVSHRNSRPGSTPSWIAGTRAASGAGTGSADGGFDNRPHSALNRLGAHPGATHEGSGDPAEASPSARFPTGHVRARPAAGWAAARQAATIVTYRTVG